MRCRRSPNLLYVLSLALMLSGFGLRALEAQQDIEGLEEQAIQRAVAAVAPSVVKIETLGGLERVGKVLIGTGPTTGLVVSEDGHIISSAFNFVQQPSSILVTLPSGGRAAATIVARDHSRMLVLLKVKTSEKLPVPVAVPRSEMAVGQWAIAVGRTYDQPGPNLSVGVLSALNRVWGRAIQTDAKISPNNYGGPLVDIQGRVLGVLVPLSPQGQSSEVAGAEWYDSGIGFAVPLSEINERLPTLIAGKDLHAGLLGISLKPGDIYSLPAEIAASQPGSPAYKAGLKAGDIIVEADGVPIERQAQLKHVLGAVYAGDKVNVVAKRGAERVTASIELVDKLVPYQHPFLGILPMRGVTDPAAGAAAGSGVRVRYVYPGSPAAEAGLQPGDRVVGVGDIAVLDATQLRNHVANLELKTKVTLKVARGDQTLSVELTTTSLPTEIPAELPPGSKPPAPGAGEPPAVGLIEIKLPEETKNEAALYVPENYQQGVPHGLVVVIAPPGKVDREALVARWKELCERHQLIVLAPQSASSDKWEPTESAYIRKTIDEVVGRYTIDLPRICAFGHQSGGSMAYLVGFEHVDRVRAIAVVDAIPPVRVKPPENDPINRLAFYQATAEKSASAPMIKAVIARLEAAKFPVTTRSLGEQARELSDDELAELARWVDTLDRI